MGDGEAERRSQSGRYGSSLPPAPDATDTTVLIVDGGESPQAISERLERQGYRVIFAESGEQALRQFGEGIDPANLGQARIVGASPAIEAVRTVLRKIARSPASTVLLTGESGTGKDLAARYIHRRSQRLRGPFLHITCSALPENLLESELFGHEMGAFTDAKERKLGLLEQADGGVVFLDEIGEMSPGMQAKLLRFLEEGTFRRVGGHQDIHPDVRVIAATNKDLRAAIDAGEFRADLYYRLSVLAVALPPLRERHGDVMILIDHFIERFNRQFSRSVRGVSRDARSLLEQHPWPGNVRELRNAVERAVLLADSDLLGPDDFPSLGRGEGASGNGDYIFLLPPEGVILRELERQLIIQALERTGGNQTRAATLLGLNRDQIRYRIEKYGLRV